MSSIRALAECSVPDDFDGYEILFAGDDAEFKTSLDALGIEGTIGDKENGGDPSLSKILDIEDNVQIDDKEQEEAI